MSVRITEGARRAARASEGQMTVELAVTVPVVIVVALVVVNLMGYVEACAAFDQAALDVVVSHGVAPSGELGRAASVEAVRAALEEALGREGTCEIEVRAEDVEVPSGGAFFVVSPLLTRFTCTLVYHPWPRLLRMPGITYEAPLALRHERSLVVDRYRSGVVV